MIDKKELAHALRCSATVGAKCDEKCKYRIVEEIRPDIPVKPDIEKDGVGYWITCDFDRIALDAAEVIEVMEVNE